VGLMIELRVARPKSTDSYCFQGGVVSKGKLNFAAPDWILGGWVVLKNKVCNHNYTTPANERGPARRMPPVRGAPAESPAEPRAPFR
jgi:hypothetical protein